MKPVKTRSFFVGFLGAGVLAIFLSAAAAPPRTPVAQPPAQPPEIILEVDPAQSKVHFSVDSSLHTVHGTFNVKSGSVHFDPATGKAGGEIVVAASSGDSGNHGRDDRMHREILETPQYPDALFRPTQVEGAIANSGPSDVKLRGVLSLHGGDHEVTAQVHAELTGAQWKGTASFDIPYVTWGLKNPSNFFLKVKREVHVTVDIAGGTRSPASAQHN